MTSRHTVFVISLMFILFACAKVKYANVIWTDETAVATKSCDDEKKCLNGASCKVEDSQEFCKCLSGTSGDFCEIVKGCDTVDCGSYGDVHCAFDGKSGGYCKCNDVKKLYDPEKKECRTPCKDECENSGECEGNGDAKFCKCKTGTRGDLCETVIDCSIYKICGKKRDVKCVYDVRIGGSLCLCEDPRKKFFRDSMECTRTCKFSCSNAGVCEDMGDAKFCKCKPGTSGDTCQIITDCTRVGFCGYQKDVECVYDKKKEGGTCHCDDPKKSFYELYKKCITSCRDSGDCQPFERCTFSSLYGNFCLCQQGKSGKKCEIITDCLEGKYRNCKGNNGQCRYNEEILDAECDCGKEKKWDEKNNLCRSPCKDDCKNYGECEEDDDTKFCKCKLGTRGDYCEVVTDCSIDQFCGNKEDVECVYDVSIGGAICKCDDPDKLFSRELKKCAITCNGNCSNNGICEDNGGAKFCKCKLGFSGDLCETVTDCTKYGFCGYQKDVDCVYDETKGEGTCRCRDPEKSFNQHEKKCANRCKQICGTDPGVKCVGDLTSDENITCECSDLTEVYVPENKKCIERCAVKCGTDPAVTCSGYRTSDETTICGCSDDKKEFWSRNICNSRCYIKCGYSASCTGDQTSYETTFCGCNEGYVYDYESKNCKKDPCKTYPCLNGGTCEFENGKAKCECRSPYAGDLCEKVLDLCNPNPCKNNGDCENESGKSKCLCKNGYTGDQCEIAPDPCYPNPCKNFGQCVTQGGISKCFCESGYTGDHCEIAPDPCKPNPCKNEGHCVHESGIAKCVCESGYTGAQCEIAQDPCEPNPCKNNGHCLSMYGKFICFCEIGYTGQQCEIAPDPCNPNHCKNNGQCANEGGKYKCYCKDGYTGDQCEIDRCFPNPCKNSGTCHILDGNIRCSCTLPYSGCFCEEDYSYVIAVLVLILVIIASIWLCRRCCVSRPAAQIFISRECDGFKILQNMT